MNDTLVSLQAGEHVLKVHASVLIENSEYFKAIMLSGRWPQTPLLVPFVHPMTLIRLVHFMYSRHLDVAHQSVQDVLLTARLLGMPGAVGACQDILAQQGLARPMPFPWIWGPPWGPSPSMDVYRSPWTMGLMHHQPPHAIGPPLPSPTPPALPVPFMGTLEPSPCCEETDSKGPQESQTATGSCSNQQKCPEPSTSSSSSSCSPCPSPDHVKVVIDIAWCDGPVRFQRVLNDNCSLVDTANPVQDRQPTKRPKKLSSAVCRQLVPTVAIADQAEPTTDPPDQPKRSKYTCLYCKLSFKNHHCYVKHKRRHLNPSTLDTGTETAPNRESTSPVEDPVKSPSHQKVPGSPLELNVPFYPCKSCGSKFPSYYFVHKHSKVCEGSPLASVSEKDVPGTVMAVASVSGSNLN